VLLSARDDAFTEVDALRLGLLQHCLEQRLHPYYFDHEDPDLPLLSLEQKSDEQHIGDLVPIAESVCRLLEVKPPCVCVFQTAHRLEKAIRAVWHDVEAGCY
jgi:hypothetical protein